MGVACSRGNQSPRDETKKPITREVVAPNGLSNGTLPPKPIGNSNNKTTSESETTSQLPIVTTVRVKAGTPEPITTAHLNEVSKALEIREPVELDLLKHERGNETPRDEVGIEDGGDEVKSDEGRGSEHSEPESVPTQEQNGDSELKVSENETNATEEHIQSDTDVLPQSDQNTSVTAATDESETRGDLNTSTSATEPDTGVTQEQIDSQIIEDNAKALVAEVISVATVEEQGGANKLETDETAPSE